MKYSGETYSVVVYGGEIVAVTDDCVEALNMASEINEGNTRSAISDAEYDLEELTDDEIDEFGAAAGFEGGYAYSEEVTIPGKSEDNNDIDDSNTDEEVEDEVTDDDYFSTDRGDHFKYYELICMIDQFLKDAEEAENKNKQEIY